MDLKLKNQLSKEYFGVDGIGECDDCGMKPILDIEEVVASFETTDGWGPEHSTYAILKRQDGKYYALEEGCDTTGHGCQCGFFLSDGFETPEEAFTLGLGASARDELTEKENQ